MTRTIPTTAAVYKAARLFYRGVDSIEVGLRSDADGETTEDSRAWPDDNDLDDLVGIASILKAWRKTPPAVGVELDLYLYHEWDGLLANVDLVVLAGPDGELRFVLTEVPLHFNDGELIAGAAAVEEVSLA